MRTSRVAPFLWRDPRVLSLKNKLSLLFFFGLLNCADKNGEFTLNESVLHVFLPMFRAKEIRIYLLDLESNGLISKSVGVGKILRDIVPEVLKKKETKPPKQPKSPKAQKPPKTRAIWEVFSQAKFNRYGVEPLNNVKSRSILSKLIDYVGEDVAIDLVRFYFQHPLSKYSTNGHPLSLLILDCDWLYTQMKNERPVTDTGVREYLNIQKQQDLVQGMKDILKNKRSKVDY